MNANGFASSASAPAPYRNLFRFHVGDLRGVATASILVANVSGGDVVADVFIGTAGGRYAGKYSNGRIENHTTWRIDLQPDDENSNIVVTSTAEVIVQLVIDDGRLNALTVLPTAP